MIKVPRLLQHGSRIYLVDATYDMGVITDVAGPYQCVGDGLTASEFVAQLTQRLTAALHSGPVLTLDDLPADVRAKIGASPQPSPPSSSEEPYQVGV